MEIEANSSDPLKIDPQKAPPPEKQFQNDLNTKIENPATRNQLADQVGRNPQNLQRYDRVDLSVPAVEPEERATVGRNYLQEQEIMPANEIQPPQGNQNPVQPGAANLRAPAENIEIQRPEPRNQPPEREIRNQRFQEAVQNNRENSNQLNAEQVRAADQRQNARVETQRQDRIIQNQIQAENQQQLRQSDQIQEQRDEENDRNRGTLDLMA